MEIDPKFKKLWEEAQANQRRLIECKGPHEFVDLTPDKKIGKSFRCSKCSGEASGTDVHWYKMGMEHARRERAEPVLGTTQHVTFPCRFCGSKGWNDGGCQNCDP